MGFWPKITRFQGECSGFRSGLLLIGDTFTGASLLDAAEIKGKDYWGSRRAVWWPYFVSLIVILDAS